MNADGLSRIAMSSGLAASLSRATDYARAQAHAEVTLEHMLLALCDDPDAVLVLAASNVNVAELMGEIGRQLAALPVRAPGQDGELIVASDLRRILEAAAAAARGGRRREINGAIVLAAIVGDGKSAAAHILSAQGMTFEGAIRALQAKPTAAAEPSGRPLSTDAESILASARERVQSRTVTAPPRRLPPPEEPVHEVHAPEREEPRFEPQAERLDAAIAAPTPIAPSHEQQPIDHQRSAAPFHDAQEPAFEPPPPARQNEPHFDEFGPAEDYGSPGYAPENHEPVSYVPEPSEPFGEPAYDFGAPPMPASPPYPPPVPAPSPPEGWAPPPSPAPGGPPRLAPPPPPQRGAPLPPPFPPAAGAPRPGPPPLAPWPEPERGFGGGTAPGGPAGHEAKNRQMPPQAQPMPRPAGRGASGRAEIGQLVENIPRSMRVAVPAMIEVRIARADVQALAEGLQGGGAAYQHEVMITKAMSVRLRAPDGGFYIETASPETQWIERATLMSQDDFASWRWHVTPREAGRKRLQLIISARTMSADGLVAETALPDQVITVRVRTNYTQVASRWIGWGAAAVAGGLLAKFGEGAFAIVGRMIGG
jgi:hypothetical protein